MSFLADSSEFLKFNEVINMDYTANDWAIAAALQVVCLRFLLIVFEQLEE